MAAIGRLVATLATESQWETEALGGCLGRVVRAGDVVLLSGDLGAGKTQLVKGLAEELGVAEPITSPTFNLMLVHPGRLPLYHFDLYRLETAEQLEDIDYWATLEGDGVSAVEWGDRFPEALPIDGVLVCIEITGDESRELDVSALGPRGEALAREWTDASRTQAAGAGEGA